MATSLRVEGRTENEVTLDEFDTMSVLNGGVAVSTAANSYSFMGVINGGKATLTTVNDGSQQYQDLLAAGAFADSTSENIFTPQPQ